jgi:hypothetical protein
MKLQGFKRIVKENFPSEYHSLIEAIAGSVNDFSDDVANAFNKRITVEDNLNMEYKQIELSVTDTGKPVNKTEFKISLVTPVKGLSVIRVDNLTNSSTYPTNTPFITYSSNNNIITVNHITGLLPNNKYRIVLLALG